MGSGSRVHTGGPAGLLRSNAASQSSLGAIARFIAQSHCAIWTAMRRAQSLSRAVARLTQPCERMSPVVLAEVVGRQDAGVHASAIGAPSARFVEQRAIVGQAGFFQRSFASSSLEGPFRGTPVLLTSSDIAASSAARAADDGEDDDESEEDDNDSSQALMDIPRLESMSRKKQQCVVSRVPLGSALWRPEKLLS